MDLPLHTAVLHNGSNLQIIRASESQTSQEHVSKPELFGGLTRPDSYVSIPPCPPQTQDIQPLDLLKCHHCNVIFASSQDYIRHCQSLGNRYNWDKTDKQNGTLLATENRGQEADYFIPEIQAVPNEINNKNASPSNGVSHDSSSQYMQRNDHVPAPVFKLISLTSLENDSNVPVAINEERPCNIESMTTNCRDSTIIDGQGETIECSICHVKCKDILDYTSHLKDHSNVSDAANSHLNSKTEWDISSYKCVHCNVIYFSQMALENHLKQGHGIHLDKTFKCEKCDTLYLNEGTLKAHLSMHNRLVQNSKRNNPTNVNCNIPRKPIDERKKKVNPTIVTVEEPKNVGSNNVSPTNVIDHTNSEKLKCESSSVKYEQKYFFCTLCDKSFAQEENLTAHFAAHFNSSDTDSEKINCTNSFPWHGSLLRRMKVNNSNRFRCSVCAQSFDHLKDLQDHMTIHDYPLTCKYCSQTFRLVSQLIEHLKSHSNDRPFSCSDRSKSYKHKTTLIKHSQINPARGSGTNINRQMRHSQCLMCLDWFKRPELIKHMWKCRAKRPCLNRIVKVRAEINTKIKEKQGSNRHDKGSTL